MNVWRSDSQGRVAAGGDITMSNYAVGLLASPAKYSMISGEMSALVPDQSFMGGVFAGGNIQLKNFGVYGRCVGERHNKPQWRHDNRETQSQCLNCESN